MKINSAAAVFFFYFSIEPHSTMCGTNLASENSTRARRTTCVMCTNKPFGDALPIILETFTVHCLHMIFCIRARAQKNIILYTQFVCSVTRKMNKKRQKKTEINTYYFFSSSSSCLILRSPLRFSLSLSISAFLGSTV